MQIKSIAIEKFKSNLVRKDAQETPKGRKSLWYLPLPPIQSKEVYHKEL
jgi:hypothetical protein